MKPMAVGVFSHSLRPANPDELFRQLAQLDLKVIQLALIDPVWRKPSVTSQLERLLKSSDIEVQASFFGFPGEDYSSMPSIRETGGFAVDFQARLAIVREVIRLSRGLGITAVGGHAGFIPEDRRDPQWAVMMDRIERVADEMKDARLRLLLETGQETPDGLLQVLNDLGRDNVAVNFDPANILLYGVGDPIEAARKLAPHIASVHAKDAVLSGKRDVWGTEKLLGEGAVGYPRLLRTLREVGFTGPLIIECEMGGDPLHNVGHARDRLRTLLGQMEI